jgi:hypothetical protein
VVLNEIGGCDVVLGVEWLRTLGFITMDFLELAVSFYNDGNSYTFKVLKVGSLKIIIFYRMEKILKRVIFALLNNFMLFKPLRSLLSESILNRN